MVKVTYKTGDKVFAKVKGYPPWPARIEGDTGKKKYNVLFYGTQETGAIKPEDICYYSKNKGNYVHKYLKRAGYDDAVKQIEEAIKKDGGDGNDGVVVGDESINDVDMSDASSVSSVSEKKLPKRKVASLPDEPVQKKVTGRPRRRSTAITDSKEDLSEEPVLKRGRRKSNASTDNESKEDPELPTSKKYKKSNGNGIPEEHTQNENEQGIQKVEEESESEPSKIEKTEKRKSKDTEESGENVTEIEAEETEESESAVENEKNEQTENKEKSPKKSKHEGEDTKKPKETEFVEIEHNTDSGLQMEEEASEEAEKTVVKIDIVTEQMLNNNILYAEHVKKHEHLYKDKRVESRQESKDQVLAVKLPSGTMCGVKLHTEWPLEHDNEHERALYDEKVAKSILEIKDLLSSGNKSLSEVNVVVIPDIQMTAEDIKELTYGRDIESKRKRLDRLKKESDLVTWDSKIKNNLGLDKALPDSALDCLKEFSKIDKDLDLLMCKKHPHVMDTVRRLRKYVGNVKEWDMTTQDMEVFTKKADRIRNEAEKIYNKIKNVVNVQEEKGTFWDSYMDLVSDFRMRCKGLSETEVLVLCAEPDSRQAFLDKLDEVTESEGTGFNASNTSEPVLKETSVQGWTEKK